MHLYLLGKISGYSDLIRPPFFSFITSLFVRMGYTSIITVFAVDGGFFVFGVIGFYLLLKTRFNNIESFLGSLIYATFPIVIAVVGVGFSDLASVSLTIWAFYFIILAVKNDSRFFYLAFPFAMFAFLARYNSALIIFPIFLYILINKDEVNFKSIFFGITASILTAVPLLIFYYAKFGNLFYPFMSFFGMTSTPISPGEFAYEPNIFFFIEKFPVFIGISGFIIVLTIVLGFFIYWIFLKLKKNVPINKNIFNGISLGSKIKKLKLVVINYIMYFYCGNSWKN